MTLVKWFHSTIVPGRDTLPKQFPRNGIKKNLIEIPFYVATLPSSTTVEMLLKRNTATYSSHPTTLLERPLPSILLPPSCMYGDNPRPIPDSTHKIVPQLTWKTAGKFESPRHAGHVPGGESKLNHVLIRPEIRPLRLNTLPPTTLLFAHCQYCDTANYILPTGVSGVYPSHIGGQILNRLQHLER
jgi:hypothetical protein